MAQNPKFTGLDGTLRETYIYGTTSQYAFITGTIDADTADVLVSIRGGTLTSDPDLVTFEGTTFTIPNPSAYPEGLELLQGENTVQVKGILTNGRPTATSSVTIRLVTDKDIGPTLDAPTGVFLERFAQHVTIHAAEVDSSAATLIGYNFWASKDPGGGQRGYYKLNPSPITTTVNVEETSTLGEIVVDALTVVNPDGTLQADPQSIQFISRQVDGDETVLQTDYSSLVEIPEGLDQYRATVTLEAVTQVARFSFEHDRQANLTSSTPTIPNSSFLSVQPGDPLYYVVSAVYAIDGIEYESAFSPEVAGAPLVATPTVGAFPTVTRAAILGDAITSINRSQPDLDVKPGSFIRDTFLDPFSTEAERIRFILDFFHRATSFSTLLAVDDPNNTGESISVSASSYKQAMKEAFFLQSDASVQTMIDNAFDKLASNVGVTREPSKRSRGQIQGSIATRPTTSINYGVGTRVTIGGRFFRLTSPLTITANGAGASYNPVTGRYSATAFAIAESPGRDGNIAAGQRGTIEGAVKGLSISNLTAFVDGEDTQSNRLLAETAMRRQSSVDTGTEQGILAVVHRIPNVDQVNVVGAGHPLMFRDWVDGTPAGGKVDVWVKGDLDGLNNDTFAFTFDLVKDAQFEPVGDLQDLVYRVVHDRVTEDNPIIEMLDYADYGYKMRNVTQSYDFDLTDVEVLTYDTIRLSSDYNDPLDASITDIVTGSFRFRTSRAHTFTNQPVNEVLSFTGEVSGLLDPSTYAIVRTQDPLNLGRSTLAEDQLQVTDSSIGVPSSAPIAVEGEQHVILDGVEYLDKLGINPLTVRVYDENRVTLYVSPFASAATNDFTFVQGTDRTPLGILLTENSDIVEGQTLSIDYSYDENYTVQYTTFALPGVAQEALDDFCHATADLLAKAAIPMPLDITATVAVKNTQNQTTSISQVESEIRTALARFADVLKLGEPVRQSDIVRVIDAVPDVSYVVTPVTKMGLQDGTTILREPISVDDPADVTYIEDWSNSRVSVYLLNNVLTWPTDDGGGPSTEFRAVYVDGDACTHYNSSPNVNGYPLKVATYGAFIIGNGGLLIPGVSDDTTLDDTYTFPSATAEADRDAKRIEITKNRVLITLPADVNISELDVTVTYQAFNHSGVQNVTPNAASYVSLGDITLIMDEDFDFRQVVTGRRA